VGKRASESWFTGGVAAGVAFWQPAQRPVVNRKTRSMARLTVGNVPQTTADFNVNRDWPV